MKDSKKEYSYLEWFGAEEMHDTSKSWLSELNFLKDEGIFLEDLITSYTLDLISSKKFPKSRKLVGKLNDFEKENNRLIEMVGKHELELKIMLDGVNQIEMEKAYMASHRELMLKIKSHNKDFTTIKSQLYREFRDILKSKKKWLSQ